MEIVSYKPGATNTTLDRISSRALQMNAELVARVAQIVDGVRAGGDEALIHFTKQYDGVSLRPDEIRVAPGYDVTDLVLLSKDHGVLFSE